MKQKWPLLEVPLKARVLIAGAVASFPFYTSSEDAPFYALLGFVFVMFATSRVGQLLDLFFFWW